MGMSTNQRIRAGVPSLYAVAIVTAFFFASGTVAAAVVVIGAMLVGLTYRLTAPAVTSGSRSDWRAARQEVRRNR